MTDDEFDALKDSPAPPPRGHAKAAALAAAMAAFDSPEKSGEAAKGNPGAAHQTHASNPTRRQTMRAPMFYKTAASIAGLIVATSAAVYFVSETRNFSGRHMMYDRLGEDDRDAVKDKAPSAAPAPVAESGERTRETDTELVRKTQKEDAAGGDRPQPRGRTETLARTDADRSPAQEQPSPPPLVASQDDAKAPVAGKKSESKVAAVEPVRTGPTQGGATTPGRPNTVAALEKNAPAKSAPKLGMLEKPAAPSGQAKLMQELAEKAAADGAMAGVEYRDQPSEPPIVVPEQENRDKFEVAQPSPVKQVATEPVSTFSIDVDTASYSFVRRALNAGRLPPKDAVRVEEMINYFPYSYPKPETAEVPFQPTVTVTPAPWKPTDKLVHIGIKGYDLTSAERPRANLVFLIDISGSMAPFDRLPLVKNAFRMLVDELKPDDTVGIVTYASGSGIALEPTRIAQKSKILAAVDRLGAGGSTAGAEGLSDAYRFAEAHFDKTGVNRIILATDGDFNVGISDQDELKGFIERKRASGIFLSILGVGQGNYQDSLMQALAQNGNGTASYVDTLNEARKVLVDEASSTLFTIAKDVKIQVEFNPLQVSEYRLIGYETRALRREDFNNDKVDAGDIGSGHTVTAIYEVTPVGAPKLVDDLRYGKPVAAADAPASGQSSELGVLKLRYKLPNEEASKLITVPITPALEKPDLAAAPEDVRFSVAVAAFGQILRGQPYIGNYGYDDVISLAQTARGNDPFGYRAEFLNLVRLARSAKP
jgi:Ca-activated chloride channel family protein